MKPIVTSALLFAVAAVFVSVAAVVVVAHGSAKSGTAVPANASIVERKPGHRDQRQRRLQSSEQHGKGRHAHDSQDQDERHLRLLFWPEHPEARLPPDSLVRRDGGRCAAPAARVDAQRRLLDGDVQLHNSIRVGGAPLPNRARCLAMGVNKEVLMVFCHPSGGREVEAPPQRAI